MTNAQSKHMETKTIVIDLSKHINSENIIKDIATDIAKQIKKDTTEDTSNTKDQIVCVCEYCNIGLGDMEYFTVDDQETMCEDCMELHYYWCPQKDDMVKKEPLLDKAGREVKKITTEDINNWKGWSEEDKELLKKLNEIEEEEREMEREDMYIMW